MDAWKLNQIKIHRSIDGKFTVDSSASRMLYKSCDRLGIPASEAGRFWRILPVLPRQSRH